MAQQKPSRFGQIRERRMESPAFRERYDRAHRVIALTQELLETIDRQRQAAGLSKAELARRAGIEPAAVRRLLGSGSSNPTLRTVLELLDALGIDIQLRAKRPSKPVGSTAASSHTVPNIDHSPTLAKV